MKEVDPYLGQVLDSKYRLERLLGRGGMGSVYLATHLGTERYVALKLITPQFMRNEEFVARFKREARAAGRLRHPNVVDVTDFGFADAGGERVAYLVMEYLDGCTLADVLAEENQLPLDWVVDILEQVSSAVHEAHQQGIIHRDLKPENIWLEPNRLGGYRVKVLDFGIAKLAEADAATVAASDSPDGAGLPTVAARGRDTMVEPATDLEERDTLVYAAHGDGQTQPGLVQAPEEATQLFSNAEETSPGITNAHTNIFDDDRTLMLDEKEDIFPRSTNVAASGTRGTKLTRLGAIIGTPLYMSPEQCAAKPLDARSDIYSLGVIAYQMLAGDPPFTGPTQGVIRNHIKTPPPPLRERAKKVSKRAAQIVMMALEKDPARRPQTAAAFANQLRAQAEGIGSLYRRAFALYSTYFPQFIKLSLIAHAPVVLSAIIMAALMVFDETLPKGMSGTRIAVIVGIAAVGLFQIVAYFLAAATISGMTAIIVTQLEAAPLRPLEMRTAFAILKRRWWPFMRTALNVTIRIIIGFILLVIPGMVMQIRYALYAPVVLVEGLEKKAALQRARQLAARSWRTVIIVSILQFVIPMVISGLASAFAVRIQRDTGSPLVKVSQQFSGLINIFILPLMSIVPALLYLKMRQFGGESLSDALAQIEDVRDVNSAWRQRMRTRLSLHTPRSGNQQQSAGPVGTKNND
ncbi:MAG TPA: serine/threonine-protein kinase [Pyrinomonadaceae bacterium]|nr:serine/threonine-protein kinase [Pyrinomonadaceae bacterium]